MSVDKQPQYVDGMKVRLSGRGALCVEEHHWAHAKAGAQGMQGQGWCG